MNDAHNLFDLKTSVFGFLFFVFTSLDIEIALKIIGSVLFIGYTARRWWLLEKYNKDNNLKF